MSQVVELKHPLISHHLSYLRDKTTSPMVFREQVRRLSLLLAYEATSKLPTQETQIETPLEKTSAKKIACRLALVPILRAGLGMSGAIHDLIPQAEVWHLGFYRDETTHKPIEYYQKFSENPPPIAFVIDPMLATGGSADEGIKIVKKWGVKKITMLCLIATPEGIKKLQTNHPDVHTYTCSIDRCLNEKAYILPGLGDAGDRLFNTL